jgi:hypothetical protein
LSLYDRIIAEDSRRKGARARAFDDPRSDATSPKTRKRTMRALRKANVHPTKSTPAERHAAVSKDDSVTSRHMHRQDRTARRRMSTPAQNKARDAAHRARRGKNQSKPGYKMVFGRWVRARRGA